MFGIMNSVMRTASRNDSRETPEQRETRIQKERRLHREGGRDDLSTKRRFGRFGW